MIRKTAVLMVIVMLTMAFLPSVARAGTVSPLPIGANEGDALSALDLHDQDVLNQVTGGQSEAVLWVFAVVLAACLVVTVAS